jgi:Fe2+ or Zn2+ uptake regulation protein
MPRKSRNTKQKEIIETVIGQKDEFFTADELFIDVKKIDELIGIATIYRYLKDLRKSEKIFHYMCDGKALYSKNKKSHCHFICEETGKVIHFDVDSLDFLKGKIPGSISSFQIEVKGKCIDCCK